jgi:hypothetical protein
MDYPKCATCKHWLPVDPPSRYWWHTDELWAEEQAAFAATPPANWRYCGYASAAGSLLQVDDSAEGVKTHESFGCAAHETRETSEAPATPDSC